jgi:hypothetical protein
LRERALGALIQAKDILVAADAAGRDLTPEEDAQVSRLNAASKQYTAQYQASQAAFGATPRERVGLVDMHGQQVPFPGGASYGGAGIMLPGGIRVMGPKDKFASLVPADAPGTGLSLAQLVSGLVTGRDLGIDLRTQMGVGSATGGATLVPAPLSAQLIDLARNQARVIQAGATVVPMTSSTLRVPRQTAGAAGEWKPENAALAAINDLTFDAVTLQAHTIMAIAKISVELAEDGQDVNGVIERDLTAALALAMDFGALRGAKHAGTDQDPQVNPVGVRYTDGVTVTPVGPIQDYVPFSQAVQRIREDNYEATGVILTPGVAGIADRLIDAVGNTLTEPASWRGLAKFSSNQAGEGEAYVADWTRLLIGLRTDIAIEVSRVAGDADGSAFRNLQVWIRAYARMDAVVGQPNAFEVLTGIDEWGS